MHRVLSVLRVYFCFCFQSLENVDKTITILFLRIHELCSMKISQIQNIRVPFSRTVKNTATWMPFILTFVNYTKISIFTQKYIQEINFGDVFMENLVNNRKKKLQFSVSRIKLVDNDSITTIRVSKLNFNDLWTFNFMDHINNKIHENWYSIDITNVSLQIFRKYGFLSFSALSSVWSRQFVSSQHYFISTDLMTTAKRMNPCLPPQRQTRMTIRDIYRKLMTKRRSHQDKK